MKVKIRENNNTYNLIYYSKSMLIFFTDIIGIPAGCKCDKISIPPIFIDSPELTRHFIKGFADADFCIVLKKRYKSFKYYPVIIGTSKSRRIIEQIVQFLIEEDFKVSTEFDRIIFDKRFGYTQKSIISLYGHVQLVKWMKMIGFSNIKNINVFERWKVINENNVRVKKAFKILNGSEERNFMNREPIKPLSNLNR